MKKLFQRVCKFFTNKRRVMLQKGEWCVIISDKDAMIACCDREPKELTMWLEGKTLKMRVDISVEDAL